MAEVSTPYQFSNSSKANNDAGSLVTVFFLDVDTEPAGLKSLSKLCWRNVQIIANISPCEEGDRLCCKPHQSQKMLSFLHLDSYRIFISFPCFLRYISNTIAEYVSLTDQTSR
jgi:hypothetical protein